MKHRLSKAGSELVTKCNQLKMVASDGKRSLTDCLPQEDMLVLVDATPSKHAVAFAKWLITGENQLDSKSRDKAYELWDSSLMLTIEVGTVKGLQQIHSFLFGGLYDFAGQTHTKNIDKGGFHYEGHRLFMLLRTKRWRELGMRKEELGIDSKEVI